MTYREIPEQYLDGYARILTEVSATGRRLTREEIESRRTLGEQAAEAGHGLRALVGAHLARPAQSGRTPPARPTERWPLCSRR